MENQGMAQVGAVKVFRMNEQDWVAAGSTQEAREFYLEHTGMSAEEAFEDDPICEVSAEAMGRLKYHRDDDQSQTWSFKEQLEHLIAAGEKFPLFFASSEW